jgi:hypothetical protein
MKQWSICLCLGYRLFCRTSPFSSLLRYFTNFLVPSAGQGKTGDDNNSYCWGVLYPAESQTRTLQCQGIQDRRGFIQPILSEGERVNWVHIAHGRVSVRKSTVCRELIAEVVIFGNLSYVMMLFKQFAIAGGGQRFETTVASHFRNVNVSSHPL